MLKRLFFIICLIPGLCFAQSSPGFIKGQVPSPGQWNSYFSSKKDYVSNNPIGQFISASLANGSAITLTTNVPASVTSIALTTGDWDVTGNVDFLPGASTSVTNFLYGVSSTAAAFGTQETSGSLYLAANVPGANVISFACPTVRFNITSTTTIYLVAQAAFTASTLKAYGVIRARRVN